jgi:hypothetical protein
MATVLIALPIPPGSSEELARGFAQEVNAKLDEFAKSRTDLGVTQEAWAVQDLPDGGQLFILCLGGDDPVKANRLFAESQQAFDRWFKDTAGPILNADFNQPLWPESRTAVPVTLIVGRAAFFGIAVRPFRFVGCFVNSRLSEQGHLLGSTGPISADLHEPDPHQPFLRQRFVPLLQKEAI